MTLRHKATYMLCVILTMGSNCLPFTTEEISEQETVDLSGFQEFEYQLRGFIDETNNIYSALIQKQSDGRYLLQMSIVTDILEEYTDLDDRNVTETLPDRFLNEAEVQQMQEIFAAVIIDNVYYYPICAFYAWFNNLRWDELQLSPQKSCGGIFPSPYPGQSLSNDSFTEVLNFLDSLQNDS